MIIKALSLKQPWASLVAEGHKSIETRRWRTYYRGPLLICASKSVDRDAIMLTGPDLKDYPRGVALAVTKLAGCRPMTEKDERDACCQVYDGAWAFLLVGTRTIEPFRVRGQLNIFDVEVPDQEEAARHAARLAAWRNDPVHSQV